MQVADARKGIDVVDLQLGMPHPRYDRTQSFNAVGRHLLEGPACVGVSISYRWRYRGEPPAAFS